MLLDADRLHALQQALLLQLRRAPDGLSEHSLLKQLEALDLEELSDPFADTLGLFRAHFLLFHLLYLLADRLRAEGEAQLDISPLCIRLLPYRRSSPGLAETDPLRAYYLDLDNLTDTTLDDLERMLSRFHTRLAHAEGRAAALAVLGLEDPVDAQAIKLQYRRLAMIHHPDRGGCNDKLRELNTALEILLKS